ncbi:MULTISPECIES: hypothetical protein [unclassified Lacticaseibacillus]|uniref:hypothetical protein n=1 Tax=unclassified Lacticaseibacillus TaxID=2759744 RepID=UPI001941EE45|nr:MULTISPECIES: hypothetical protein [unclassified Lacticaseibacillus]
MSAAPSANPVGIALAWVFLLSTAVFVVSLLAWLIVMMRGRDPRLPRRVCLVAAGLAVASVALNSVL